MIEINLPLPPSANGNYRHSRRGVRLSPAVLKFRQDVAQIISDAWPIGSVPLAGPVAISVKIFPSDRRRRDIDNPIKTLFDALTLAGVWVDDSQVYRLLVERGPIQKGGACVVQITE